MNFSTIGIVAGLAFALFSCGTDNNEFRTEFANVFAGASQTDNDIKIMISAATDKSGHVFYLASAQGNLNPAICDRGPTGQCIPGTAVGTVFSRQAGTRYVYESIGTKSFQLGKYYSVVSNSGVGTLRSFTFQAADVQNLDQSGDSGTWKMALMTGYKEGGIVAWENARKKLGEMFTSKGVSPKNIKHLSMDSSQGVTKSSAQNLESSVKSLSPSGSDKCLFFMTSHGSRQGFSMQGQGTLSPSQLEGIIDRTCGKQPTVVIVSACYSGVMLTESVKKPNRVFLTAANPNVTSFGCDASSTYTFFDQCLIESLPKAETWSKLGEINTQCVKDLEKQRGMPHYSDPQVFIGSQVQNLATP